MCISLSLWLRGGMSVNWPICTHTSMDYCRLWCFVCLRSSVMALVSFVGPLVSAEMTKVSPDKWYLWFSPQHPPWTGHGVVRVPTASSWCKDMCTVTFGLTTGFESFCKDQTKCLTKPADGKSFLCLGDAQSVGFLCVLRSEQRGNWHAWW